MRPAPDGGRGRTGQRCGRMLKKFIGYYRPHVGLFAPDMVCALLIAAVDLLFPMVSRYAMQELLPHNSYLTLC